MINVLVPCLGGSQFFKDSLYPKLLYEVQGKPIIERVVNNLKNINKAKLIFVLSQSECTTFHIDSIIRVLLQDEVRIIKLNHQTR